jgi:hypothetical protein
VLAILNMLEVNMMKTIMQVANVLVIFGDFFIPLMKILPKSRDTKTILPARHPATHTSATH